MAAGVIAYKFLDEGAVGPFTGFRWPAREWVDAAGVDPCLEGIHACRVRDLPVWLGRERRELNPARRGDRRAHLLEVGGAAVAEDEMLLEALAIGRCKRVLEIRRHQLDDVLTGEFSVQPHLMYSSRALRTFDRARWRSTL